MSNTIHAPGARVDELAVRVRAAMDAVGGPWVVNLGGDRYQTTSSSRPVWTIVLAVALFPIGLLFLLIKDVDKGTVAVVESPRGASVVISGELPPALRLAIESAIVPDRDRAASTSVADMAPPAPPSGPVGPPPGRVQRQVQVPFVVPAAAEDRTIVRPRDGGVAAVGPASMAVAPPGRWCVSAPSGQPVEMTVDGAVLVGRGPQVQIGDTPLLVDDLSVSKTHARISVDASGAVRVEDLHSTNGTALFQLGQPRTIPKGAHDTAPLPATVLVGDVRLEVTA